MSHLWRTDKQTDKQTNRQAPYIIGYIHMYISIYRYIYIYICMYIYVYIYKKFCSLRSRISSTPLRSVVFSRNALLTIWPKTINIARGLIFGMTTHVNIESTYVKNYGSSFFSFPVIDTCHIFCLKHVNLTVWPKKAN